MNNSPFDTWRPSRCKVRQQFEAATSAVPVATLDENFAEEFSEETEQTQEMKFIPSDNADLSLTEADKDLGNLGKILFKTILRAEMAEAHVEKLQNENTGLRQQLEACRCSGSSNTNTKFKEDPYMESYKDDRIYSDPCYRKTSLVEKPRAGGFKKSKELRKCQFCGIPHIWGHKNCSAYGKTCKNCLKKNHMHTVCRNKTRKPYKSRSLQDVASICANTF